MKNIVWETTSKGLSRKASRGFTRIEIVIIIVLLGLFGGLVYSTTHNKQKNITPKIEAQVPSTPPVVIESSKIDDDTNASVKIEPTDDWKTYENKEFGLSFKFPKKYFAVTTTTDEKNSNKYMILTENQDETTIAEEGCSGTFGTNTVTKSTFDDSVKESSFDMLDNFSKSISTLSEHRIAKISGTYNDKVMYALKGGEDLREYIEIGQNTFMFKVCNKTSGALSDEVKNDFDQILSTLTFAK